MLSPTLNDRSEPVGKMIDRFFRDLGMFDSSVILRSSEVALPEDKATASALLADFICSPEAVVTIVTKKLNSHVFPLRRVMI